ncbi:hypothetical protein BBK82_36215 [Lentzea guizhouensis]|uniref:Uncharacterized protein n=2 Tax=Lentzea guizhouensis TaxID=1586287 RepID=A0A1B2HSG5_9PSEU|nr:hypothetical protein BBK82_36215 [Lentzea guizhouensis]
MVIGWLLRAIASSPVIVLPAFAHTLFQPLHRAIGWLAWPALFIAIYLFVRLCALPLYHFGGHLVLAAKRRLARSAAEVMARDSRPPVLYLRTFHSDHAAGRVSVRYAPTLYGLNLRTEEESLARVFARYGPLVGLGDPAEDTLRPGAARIHSTDERWQADVIALMDQARLVILRIDCCSDALRWELRESVTRLEPHQLLLLVPADYTTYHRFCDQINAEELLPHPLPPFTHVAGNVRLSFMAVIYFCETWTPHLATISLFHSNVERDLAADLKPVFAHLDRA